MPKDEAHSLPINIGKALLHFTFSPLSVASSLITEMGPTLASESPHVFPLPGMPSSLKPPRVPSRLEESLYPSEGKYFLMCLSH